MKSFLSMYCILHCVSLIALIISSKYVHACTIELQLKYCDCFNEGGGYCLYVL